MNKEIKKDERRYGLDLLRIFSAILVLMFHLNIHHGLASGVVFIDRIISTGAVFMVLFFMLSAFSLAMTYQKTGQAGLLPYYKKRVARIFPTYWTFLLLVFIIRYNFPDNKYMLALMIPIEAVCAQAFFPQLFSYFGSGGTWFLSVLVALYIIFPFLYTFEAFVSKKIKRGAAILICSAALLIIGLGRVWFGGVFASYYANPVFRIPEFFAGILLFKMIVQKQRTFKHNNLICIILAVLSLCVYGLAINGLYDIQIDGKFPWKSNYLSYGFIALPIMCVMVYAGYKLDLSSAPKFIRKTIKVLSDYSFPFYLIQGVAVKNIPEAAEGSDITLFFAGLLINAVFAVLLHWAAKLLMGVWKIFSR